MHLRKMQVYRVVQIPMMFKHDVNTFKIYLKSGLICI